MKSRTVETILKKIKAARPILTEFEMYNKTTMIKRVYNCHK